MNNFILILVSICLGVIIIALLELVVRFCNYVTKKLDSKYKTMIPKTTKEGKLIQKDEGIKKNKYTQEYYKSIIEDKTPVTFKKVTSSTDEQRKGKNRALKNGWKLSTGECNCNNCKCKTK